jgi:hypothetical protein
MKDVMNFLWHREHVLSGSGSTAMSEIMNVVTRQPV